MKDLSDQILLKYEKSICQKNEEITSFNQKAYKAIEKTEKGKYKSWVTDIMLALDNVMKIAINKEMFIAELLKEQLGERINVSARAEKPRDDKQAGEQLAEKSGQSVNEQSAYRTNDRDRSKKYTVQMECLVNECIADYKKAQKELEKYHKKHLIEISDFI